MRRRPGSPDSGSPASNSLPAASCLGEWLLFDCGSGRWIARLKPTFLIQSTSSNAYWEVRPPLTAARVGWHHALRAARRPFRCPPPVVRRRDRRGRMGMRAARRLPHRGTPARGHFTGMPTRGRHARGAVAPAITSGWPTSADAARDRAAPRRPASSARAPWRTAGSARL